MDNINLVRVGFLIPEFKISDTDNDIGEPVIRTGECHTCLLLINPDEHGKKAVLDLENDIPVIAGGMPMRLSAAVPLKQKPARKFKNDSEFKSRLFCDYNLRLGRYFSIIDSSRAYPAYHAVVFVISEDGSVRYRHAFDEQGLDMAKFRASVKELI